MHLLKASSALARRAHGFTDEQRRLLLDAHQVLCNALRGEHEHFDRLRAAPRDVSGDVTADMTVEKLGDAWIDEILIENRVKRQTVDHYTNNLHYLILPAIGDMAIREATVGAIDRYLKTFARTHPAGARRCKSTLLQMFSLAVRHGALAANPVRDVGRLPRPHTTVQAMTCSEITRVRHALHLWHTTKAVGPRKSRACTDLFDLLLATGCRIGEACALRWQDIDLRAGTLTVAGTMIFLRSIGWQRQEFPKTAAGQRTVYLPAFAVTMLRRRQAEEPHRPDDPLFASRTGTFVQPDNMRRSLRCALQRQADLKWVSPHVFRKTVATVLSGRGLVVEAAAQLGHVDESITKRFYVQKPSTAPDVSHVLEILVDPEFGVLITTEPMPTN
ncbi:tyrosine-type recombinase/integrase [Symbioplanes lichenis]|uniref:tyrosine-type recombinase/integrase n=1 Tax=Symbioplanes lichenis TaxID=1629072 RepID=UPI0027382D2A|nr:site-specific integrase [Actinoplanes lichenis]